MQNPQERLQAIEARLQELEEKLRSLVPLHVKRKYKTCGKEGCRCRKGHPHGPYLYAYTPDKEITEKRKRKGWRGSTRREIYLGKNWTPPENWTRPQVVQEILWEHHRLVRQRERILKHMAKAGLI